jgi:integrase
VGLQSERLTVKELAEDIRADYTVNARASKEDLEYRLNHLLSCFDHLKARELGTDFIKQYIAQRQQEKAANATIKREMAALKRMFNLGIQAEKIHRKPYIPSLTENNVRKGFFEYAEFLRFRNAIADDLKPLITFAYYTDWRTGEIIKLQWNQVDLEGRTVRLEPSMTKNKEGRVIVLDGELLQVIEAQWEKRKITEIPGQGTALIRSYVFHRRGRPIKDFREAWAVACKEVGLEGKIPMRSGERLLGIWSVLACRNELQ